MIIIIPSVTIVAVKSNFFSAGAQNGDTTWFICYFPIFLIKSYEKLKSGWWWSTLWKFKYDTLVSWWKKNAAEHLTISDMRALKCWMASSLLCCSLSRSISLVCSDRAFCTSRSLSLRLASMRACRSNSRSFSMSTLCGRWYVVCITFICYVISTIRTTLENRAINQVGYQWAGMNITLLIFNVNQ